MSKNPKNPSAPDNPSIGTELTGPPSGAGFVSDYVTGTQVRATAEELDAVQVFARRLVEDYGYAKSQIQTRPQYRVRVRPSDEDKSYPVDIAVFHCRKPPYCGFLSDTNLYDLC